MYFQVDTRWICINIRTFYKGVAVAIAWKYVFSKKASLGFASKYACFAMGTLGNCMNIFVWPQEHSLDLFGNTYILEGVTFRKCDTYNMYFQTGDSLDLLENTYLDKREPLGTAWKYKYFQGAPPGIVSEICLLYRREGEAPLGVARKYMHFQTDSLWICLKIPIFYKGVPVGIARNTCISKGERLGFVWKYVCFVGGTLRNCMKVCVIPRGHPWIRWQKRIF